jgi:phage terminase large subunit GpA-like protein
VLEAIGQPGVDGVVFVAASQGGGKTEILLNAMGYYADADPAPQILVTYNVEMAEAISKHRVSAMIRECRSLRERIADARTRDSGNTIRDKMYPGGELTMVGANSAGGLSMHPKRVALFDEIDRFPASAGTEGDPVALAETRTSAYWNAVHVYSSSPGTSETSRLLRLWKKSDQNEWFVPCGECGRDQPLRWSQVQWQKDEDGEAVPETAVYICEHCGAEWDDVARWKASESGRFVPQGEFTGTKGFRVSGLAILGRRLDNIVRRWVNAQGNQEELKVFVNTVLAEWWDEQRFAKGVDETGLLARRETFEYRGERAVIPASVALLTAGIDIQDNRIEAVVYGYAHGEESWRLGKTILYGDPSSVAVWEDLDRFLLAPWPRAAGGMDFIRGACVDTGGHHTQSAYDFCAPRFRRVTPDGGRAFVFAVKGSKGAGEVWPRAHSTVTQKVPLWIIRVDPAKEQIYGRLSIAEPGPGFLHLGMDLSEADAASLVAERMRPKVNKRSGFTEREWFLPSGKRNEELDCAVYAYAALCGLRAMGYDLETAVLELPSRVLFHEAAIPSPSALTRRDSGKPRRSPVAPGWLGDTRGWIK